jgi:hypothetical protein
LKESVTLGISLKNYAVIKVINNHCFVDKSFHLHPFFYVRIGWRQKNGFLMKQISEKGGASYEERTNGDE